MALSGSIDFNMTARQLITFALDKAKIIDTTHAMSSEQLRDGMRDLNLLLKGWQIRGPNLWRQTFGSVTLVADTASYALSPQPRRIEECRYRDANGRDIPMFELTRQEYVELPDKTASGVPTQYYVDYQRTAVTLYVWPVPSSVTTETIRTTYQRRIEDIDAADNDIDIPQEYFETVGYALADRMMLSYGKRDADLALIAADMVHAAMDDDREPYVRFVPERR